MCSNPLVCPKSSCFSKSPYGLMFGPKGKILLLTFSPVTEYTLAKFQRARASSAAILSARVNGSLGFAEVFLQELVIRFVAEIRSFGKAGAGLRRRQPNGNRVTKWHPGRSG